VIERFGKVEIEEVKDFIRKVVRERGDFVRERGASALSPLMGIIMKEFRGKVDGKVISEMLREEIENYLG